jgi:hypothetical protein
MDIITYRIAEPKAEGEDGLYVESCVVGYRRQRFYSKKRDRDG